MTSNEFKAWRHSLAWTQQQTADKLGISRSSVSNYEAGYRREAGKRSVVIPPIVELACLAFTLLAIHNGTFETKEQFLHRLETTTVKDGLPTEGEAERFRNIEMEDFATEVFHNLTARYS